MASTTDTLYLGVAVALLVICGSLLLWRRQSKLYGNLPPGPRALPIVGSMHLLGKRPHRKLAELASQYGPLMSVWLGQRLCIVASTAEMAKEFLKLQDANFAFRPPSQAAETIIPQDMVFHDNKPAIRHLRKILVTELISTRQLENSRYIRIEEVASTIRKIANENGPSRINKHLMVLTTNILSRMVFNKLFLGMEEQEGAKIVQELFEIMDGMNMCFGSTFIGDFFNVPKWFDPQGLNKKFQKLRVSIDKFFEKMIDAYKEEKRRKPSKDEKKTLLDIFLEQLEFPENRVTEDHIKGVIFDLLAAGTETTTAATEWAMAEVLHNPTLRTKVTSELDRVVGLNRIVQESDLPHLKYIHAIVKETFRLHPPGPLLMPHQSKTATKAFGYDIPAQTHLFVNVFAIGRNNSNWEKPLEFLPERFLEGGKNVGTEFSGQHFDLLPFGSGRRSCPGMGMASVSMQLQLANLLHAFEWEVEESELEEGRRGVTWPIQPTLVAVAKPRLSLHLYEG